MVSNRKIATLIIITLVGLAFTGCSDDSTPAAVAPVIDTAPPAVPANADVVYDSGAATLSWAVNTVDLDLEGYLVVRENGGVSQTLVATPALITSYVDAAPPIGANHYHVYSVDTAGNQSAAAVINLEISRGHQTSELAN